MRLKLDFLIYFVFFAGILISTTLSNSTCKIREIFLKPQICFKHESYFINIPKIDNSIYILYDVNTSEGFNLKRDVFIRLAVFIKKLREYEEFKRVKMILPPFSNLYHWRSHNIKQDKLFWNHFFDLKSMKQYTKIYDFYEFFQIMNKTNNLDKKVKIIDHVYQLKNFKEMFDNGVFVEKYELENCENNRPVDFYFGYENVTSQNFTCLKFQGCAMNLKKFLEENIPKHRNTPYVVAFLNAETLLHDHWGNKDFWEARRSMRFNENLVKIANDFRLMKFNSTNSNDLVQRPVSWTLEKPYRNAIGGEYLCAHLRRADFLYGREKTTPTLLSAANQIKQNLKKLNLQKVFISSDCSKTEYKDLKSHLLRYKVVRFSPESHEQKNQIKDGGIAIIDQIICSHSKYFIGTYESTFTFRIYEEREILGFPKDTTFNTFCKIENDKNCEKNSVWPISYS